MALNFPGPYQLRLYYTTHNGTGGQLTHVLQMNLDLDGSPVQGLTFDQYGVVDNATPANVVDLDVFVESFLTILAPLFSSAFTFDIVELWKYPTPQSFDSVFWSSYGPPTAQPSAAGNVVEAGQATWTFRTGEGGTMKVVLLESVVGGAVPSGYADQDANQQALVDFVLEGGAGFDTVFLGRDTSYPFSHVRLYPGQNESLFKRRFR